MLSTVKISNKNKIDPSKKNVTKKEVTTKDIEIWEVVGLSCNVESRSSSFDFIERYNEKKKLSHQNIVKKLTDKLNNINFKAQKNIEISSTEVKAHMKHFQDQLNILLQSIDKPEAAKFSGSDFKTFQEKVNYYKYQQQHLISELYDELNKIEDKRAEENERILRMTCEQMRKVGHLLPYNIQVFAEQEILKINKLSLNNRRCFNDLKLTLTLVTEETFKSFSDRFFCIVEKWINEKAQNAFFKIKNRNEKSADSEGFESYIRLELSNFELPIEISPDEIYSFCQITQWSENVVNVMKAIESYGKKILEIYKKTTTAAFQKFYDEINDISKTINAIENLNIEERIINPIIFRAKDNEAKEFENLEFVWQSNLVEMKAVLKEVTNFLFDVAKLWNRHKERNRESKKLILQALEKDYQNSEAQFQDIEVKVNIALDLLRQEHIKSKVDKAHQTVVTLLNSIKEKYESFYVDQVTTVEDYYKMANLEADVLSAEIKEFIYFVHPFENVKYFHKTFDNLVYLPEGIVLLKEIQRCVDKVMSLKLWKQGAWIALENISENSKEFLASHTEDWIRNKIDYLAERTTMQLELLQKRFDRVRIEIYEKRLAEIDFHKDIYESHEKEVNSAFKNMRKDLKNLTENSLNKLNEIENSLKIIEENIKQEYRPGIVKTSLITTERKKKELEDNLKAQFHIFKADCEDKVTNIRQANISFMKAIKLFHEGGNYSAEEGKMFASQLEAMDKQINLSIKNILKDAAKDESDVIKRCSATFAPTIYLLTSFFEETFFNYKIQDTVRETKEKLENLIEAFRSDLYVLQEQIDCIYRIINNRNKALHEDVNEFWNSIIFLLYKNISNLFYPIKAPTTSASSEEAEETVASPEGDESNLDEPFGSTKPSKKDTVSRTPTNLTEEATENFLCNIYDSESFVAEHPPLNDGTFMGVVGNYLWSKLNFIQQTADNFYQKIQDRKIFKEDLQPTYNSFFAAIMHNFRFFGLQCEKIWLQTLLDFLPIVGRIKLAANSYFEGLLNDYEEKTTTELRNLEDDFKKNLRDQASKNMNIFKVFSKKLLPLHGFPKNAFLLKNLEEEIVQKTSGLGIEWDAAIIKFKNTMNCFRIHTLKEKKDILKIQDQYLKMRDKIFVEDLDDNLLETILEFAEKRGFCTRSLADQKKFEREDIPEEVQLNVKSFAFRTFDAYLSRMKEIVEMERLGSPNTQNCSPSSKDSADLTTDGTRLKSCPEKLSILLPPLDLNVCIENLLKRIKDKIKSMQNFAESKKNSHEEKLFKWLTIWKFNVKKVKKLYTVKYEEKPKEDESLQPCKFILSYFSSCFIRTLVTLGINFLLVVATLLPT